MNKFERIDNTEQYKINVEKANTGKYYEANPTEEVWANDKYVVHVRKDLEAMGQLMTHLSIRNTENTAIRDWRDMQYIKNELVGDENEGFELFPKESRLVDTANQFHIWVFPFFGKLHLWYFNPSWWLPSSCTCPKVSGN